MAAFTNIGDYINKLSGGNNGNPKLYWIAKSGSRDGVGTATAVNVSQWWHHWDEDGQPGRGTNPGTTTAACDNTTNGAIPLTAPGGSRELFLTGLAGQSRVTASIMLVDRLIHIRGITTTTGATTTVQSATPSPATPRNTDGIGNMIMVEMYAAIGANMTVTVDYVDQDGNAATTPSFVIASGVGDGRAFLLPLASGDTGVRSITSVTHTSASGGELGLALIHPIACLSAMSRDIVSGIPTLPKLTGSECLCLYSNPNNQGRRQIRMVLSTVES